MHNHWLFVGNVAAHWVSFMSGIVPLSLGIVEYFRKQKTEGVILAVVAFLFLIVSFDQAWQDEHRNSEVLIAQKQAAVFDSGFWKQQYYDQNSALHSRDQLLAQNYTALIGEQSTANNSQTALAKLSDKILDIGKPQRLNVIVYPLLDSLAVDENVRYFIALANKTITPAFLRISCSQDITQGNGYILGTTVMLAGPPQIVGRRQFNVSISSPAWSPQSPLMFDVHYGGAKPDCNVEVSAQ